MAESSMGILLFDMYFFFSQRAKRAEAVHIEIEYIYHTAGTGTDTLECAIRIGWAGTRLIRLK